MTTSVVLYKPISLQMHYVNVILSILSYNDKTKTTIGINFSVQAVEKPANYSYIRYDR